MARTICVAIFVLFTCQTSYSLRDLDYYWREYTGEVPEDAILGGRDINGNNIYIGQAYVKNEGLVVVQITPGVRQVLAPMKGIKKIDKYIKILCGPQQKVFWMSSNSSNLHLALIDKHAVIGGHEDGLGYINIGRISHEGEVKIGKINSFSAESAQFYFNDNGLERLITSYEILMYNDKDLDVRIKPY
ncbi:uncharacterized protein [Tenebrio molitor]|uniref:uncharacterized protein isoform X1 n=1 Tax=Tenebrio molitor TaxID=7067 RepID=UPI003624AA6C